MAALNAVWGIDIGQCALKAIKLRPAEDGKVEAIAFDVIEHPKILSQPDADRDELIGSSLEKFTSRNDWQGDRFVVGVPGQQTFARFCKMPPIDLKKDAKKIPQLVQYEASQQIPFDMDDVVWDYQIFTSEDSPDIEVGIFAIRKDLIRKHLGFFSDVGIAPQGVQTIPASLYNFCQFDGLAPEEGQATVVIDVGAQNTDLIIVEPNSAWTRNIPLGGNSFTEALVRAFKLSFAKAESLKRSAATSKYARQIFQAMRPVFADLVAEIQRSIGFYGSTRRDVELTRVLALGNAFRLPGLQKYLENNLTVSGGVVKLEKFKNILPTPTVNAPQFTENVLSFGAAYGLALQGLDLGTIRASLLPPELARVAVWKKKRPYFIGTAAALLIAAGVPLAANTLDQQALESPTAQEALREANRVSQQARSLSGEFDEAHANTGEQEQDIQKLMELQEEKLVLPRLLALVHQAMPEIYPPELRNVDSREELRELIESNPQYYARAQREQFLVESLTIEYVSNVDEVALASDADRASAGGGITPGGRTGPPGRGGAAGRGMSRVARGYGRYGRSMRSSGTSSSSEEKSGGANAGFVVRVSGRLLYGTQHSEASEWLNGNYFANLYELGRRPGLGFHVPEADPKERDRPIEVTVLSQYHKAGSRVAAGGYADPRRPGVPGRISTTPGRVAGASPGIAPPADDPEAESDVKYPDPVTGEESFYDWRVDFAFKVKLGDAPEDEPEGAQKPGRDEDNRGG